MRLIRVAAAALNQIPLDWEGNRRNILAAIEEAKEKDVQILCLPEMCITGYSCEDAFFFKSIRVEAERIFRDIVVNNTRDIIVSFGLPMMIRDSLFNVAALAADGTILGYAPKQHLAADGVHYEPRWFKAWEPGIGIRHEFKPFGDFAFDLGAGVVLGFEVCEDAWVAERPGISLAKRGANIILNPSASHFAFGKHEVRRQFVQEGSRAFRAAYIYSNLLGNESGRIIYGGDTIIASGGDILAEGQRLSFKDHIVTTAIIDVDDLVSKQVQNGAFRADVTTENVICGVASKKILERKTEVKRYDNNICLKGAGDKHEQFSRAVSLGMFDYMRKSRSKGFILSLSGGADSSACAVLIRMMYEIGCKELGTTSFLEKGGIESFMSFEDIVDITNQAPGDSKRKQQLINEKIMSQLLTCVYQATDNSSDITYNAAKNLAEKIDAKFISWNVNTIVDDYVEIASKAMGRELTWEHDDIALQNIQARVRSPGIWMLANIKNALLISTSNRSEASVGYTTVDGDTSGGFAPIAGVDKKFLVEWLNHLSLQDKWEEALKPVVDQRPTAELRPAEEEQTDENDLMPYAALDAIEREAIHKKRSPEETFEILKQTSIRGLEVHPDDETLKKWINKFFFLWRINQWKRERFAVSIHLDDANVDPKTWCRFPVLSRAFEKKSA